MNRVSFLLDRVIHMKHRDLLRVAGAVRQETGRSRGAILADLARCAVRYGAGVNDYLLCDFAHLTEEQRATYVTRGVNQRLVAMLNDPAQSHFFDSKREFYQTFSRDLGRAWLDFTQADLGRFQTFMEGREEIMVKPDGGTGGHGVERLRVADFPSARALYDKLKADGVGVVEEVLAQHPAMSALNPSSVNTLRVVTVVNDRGSHVLYAHIRIGSGDKPVDNLHSGGMFAPLDLDTGKILYPAYDKARNTYSHHPRTGTEIRGFQVPFWPESAALCLRAAQVVPGMRYVGWDVCVTPAGPVLVEGNNFPGYDILQMPPHTPDKIGMLPRIREFVDGI